MATTGQNPRYGASILYWMKEASDSVKVSMRVQLSGIQSNYETKR